MLPMHAMLPRLRGQRLLVVGDVMVDKYRWGNVDRISPEAPVMVMRTDTSETRLGGAASVAVLARALEAEVVLAGLVGDDADGRLAGALLDERTIDRGLVLCDPDRPTVSKERFIGRVANRHPHQVLRVDQETCQPIAHALEAELIRGLSEQLAAVDAVVVSDYAKGVCSPRVLAELIAAAADCKLPVVVDPARLDRYDRYAGATVLTPNRSEAAAVLQRPLASESDALAGAEQLRVEFKLRAAMITLDKQGIALDGDGLSQVFPTRPREVYDVAGAGDMVAATVGLCLAADMPLGDTVRLANTTAGLEVERIGVSPVSLDDITAELSRQRPSSAAKILAAPQLLEQIRIRRARGETVAFANGCFDLLHVGHVRFLEEAATLGDVLIVAVNSDQSVRGLKGPSRPVVKQADRAAMLAALSCVDYVVIFSEENPLALVSALRPDVFAKGGTYDPNAVLEREVVEGYGGRVCITGFTEQVSTTAIIAEVKTRK